MSLAEREAEIRRFRSEPLVPALLASAFHEGVGGGRREALGGVGRVRRRLGGWPGRGAGVAALTAGPGWLLVGMPARPMVGG
jgi:hypothetical protein